MSVSVKICGLSDSASVVAAVMGGADFVGFVFYPGSPRFIDARTASSLIEPLPADVISVGLFVNPSDEDIARVLKLVPLGAIQLHGAESPERVAAVRKLTGLPVIKAVGIASAQDIKTARAYESVADYLLLDAKPRSGERAGGNGIAFDWALLKNAHFTKPWFLAGGLNLSNAASAVAATGAKMLDISSGVEEALGRKSPEKIRVFLAAAQKL